MSEYVPGTGAINARILVLGECPTYEGKQPFDNKELNSLFQSAGINRSDCWFTTVSKYHVPGNYGQKKIPFHKRAEQAGINIQQELNDLQTEINSIKPNIILALGKSALWAGSGKYEIQDYRGSLLHKLGCKFIATYNPIQLSWQAKDIEFKGYWNRAIMLFDFKRAAEESYTKELNLPKRNLQIARNSYDLWNFYETYKSNTDVSVDIEAGGHCIPVCIGLAFNKSHGITVPLWNRDGISSIPDNDLVNCWRILSEIIYEKRIIGQNFNYDRDKIRRLGFKISKLKDDVMLKAFSINPELPVGLAFTTSIYTREPFYKNEGMYEGSYEDLFIGCARDACVTYEINDAMEKDLDELGMRAFYRTFLMKLPDLYLEIENNGFGVDEKAREELLRKYIKWDERLRYELFKLVGTEVNANSPKQISILLFDTFKCPRRDGTGEEELTSLLNLQSFTDKDKRKIVELILEDRRVRKSISTYLMALPDYDGRMKTTCFPCLNTGRSANGQQEPPIRPKIEVIDEHGKKKEKFMGIAFQTMTKHGDIGADIRKMYIPMGNLNT